MYVKYWNLVGKTRETSVIVAVGEATPVSVGALTIVIAELKLGN